MGQTALTIRYENGNYHCDESLKWGFKPAWSNYKPLINAKAATLLESKMFKGSARHKRCVVLADGFYEPKGPSGAKNRPWFVFQFTDLRVFGFAGIWIEDGFAIITTEPNKQVSPIHNRMP